MAKELDCLITTGYYLFHTPETGSSGAELMLEFSLKGTETTLNMQHWNSEHISDFVRKLGFLDMEKEGGDNIKHFLHVNEVCM